MLKNIIVLSTIAASAAANAQAGPVAKVTSDQLVCQLSGDCAKTDSSLDTQDMPESRGFSIINSNAISRTLAVTPARHPATATLVRPVSRPAPAMRYHAAIRPMAPSGPVGHADLSISFVTGSAELTASGKKLAETFMEALRAPQLAGKRFMIAGHTDAVGARDYNLNLSERRAQAMVDFLVAQGASRSQFDVKGFGFDRPLPRTSANSPSNRRVEVVKLN